MDINIKRLIAIGGRDWKSADGKEHRIYFDAKTANELAGIKKLPNFGFEFAGQKISEYRRKEISLNDFHYDVETKQFGCSGKWVMETLAAAVAEIKRRLEEPEVEPTAPEAGSYNEYMVKQQDSHAELRALALEMDQLQIDGKALTGESDPRFPEMNARYEAIEVRMRALKDEMFGLSRTYADVIRAHKKARYA